MQPSAPKLPIHTRLDRRGFLGSTLAAGALATIGPSPAVRAQPSTRGNPTICAFIKFLQDLSYEELASTVKELGFDGVEATVRKKGHVEPERVQEDLPKMVNALRAHDLEITVMASDVTGVDPLAERVLRTATELGVKRYRMGFFRYDLDRPILEQLEQIRPVIRDLVQLNAELEIQALYQNHSDAKFMGATLWDLHHLIRDYPLSQIGSAFDIRHATIEAGLAWPVLYDVMKPHIGAIVVKDFDWDGPKAKHVPLGEGRVNKNFFKMVRDSDFAGPYSLHVEYLGKEGVAANVEALRRDLGVLKSWLNA